MRRLKWIFVGQNGLRAGWKFLAYIALFMALGEIANRAIVRFAGHALDRSFAWPVFLFNEAVDFVVAVAAAIPLTLLDRTPVNYGLRWSNDSARLFGKGLVWGFIPSVLILIPIWLAGACSFHGLALHGSALVTSALGFALAMLALGFAEEFMFRGYSLQTLASGIGFWPAAAILSFLFGAVHFIFKPNEGWIDPISVGLYGMFWALTLRRTGSLWFAIGFHAMSDYTDMIVFAEPNTGNQGLPIPGHLLDVRFHGPDWLTGGPRGTEASLLVFLVLAVLFYLFDRAYPANREKSESASA